MMTNRQPRPYYFSCRVRLTEDERQTFKDAYNKVRNQSLPQSAPGIGGSMVSTQTSYGVSTLGLADITVTDLLSTRESVSISVLLKLQKVLGLDIITEKRIKDEFKGYVEVLFAEEYATA